MFYTTIHQNNALFTSSVSDNFFAAHFCYLIFIIRIYKINIISIRENEFPSHRSFFANQFCQLTRVHTKNSGNFILYQPLAQAFSCIPVTIFKRKIGNNQACSLNFFRFVISRKSILDDVIRNAVISNSRKRYCQ